MMLKLCERKAFTGVTTPGRTVAGLRVGREGQVLMAHYICSYRVT